MIDANGNRTEYRYDILGRQHEVEDALGVVNRTEFDGSDRTIRTITDYGTGNNNITVEYEYDINGRQVKVTSAVGTAIERVDLYEYDKLGRLTRQIECLQLKCLLKIIRTAEITLWMT